MKFVDTLQAGDVIWHVYGEETDLYLFIGNSSKDEFFTVIKPDGKPFDVHGYWLNDLSELKPSICGVL